MRKVKKYIEYGISLLSRMVHEKEYVNSNTKLKYLFYPCENSKELIVVFSACTRKGIPARYNYIRTLKNVNINKLYILDDGADDERGTYYLGLYPEFPVEASVVGLIKKIVLDNQIEKMAFAGSSKGGWSALNIGTLFNNEVDRIIVGAPQYYLGKYLSAPANNITLKSIVGCDKSAIEKLDFKLKNNLANLSNIKVYIHYSINEHTYEEHVKDLIKDLKEITVVEEDIETYTDHQEVSMFFPKYLYNTVTDFISESEELIG